MGHGHPGSSGELGGFQNGQTSFYPALASPVWSKNLKHLPAQTLPHRDVGRAFGLCLPCAAAAQAGLSRGFFVASQVLVERLGSWLAAVAVNRAVALIRELAQMNFLTIRGYAGMRPGEIQRIEYFLVDAVVL